MSGGAVRHVFVSAVLLGASPVLGQLVITDTIGGVFVDISGSGTALSLTDEGLAEVWPGFDLSQTMFSGGSGRVWISNNGALGFVDDPSLGAYYLNAAIPDPGLFGVAHETPQALAVFWDDLDSDTGEVYQATTGAVGSQVFIVQWQDRPHYPGDAVLDGDEATFQAQILEAAGPIKAQFLYQDVDFQDVGLNDGASATIGYQAGLIGNDVQWSHNQTGAVTVGTVLTLLELPGVCQTKGDGDGDCHIDLDDFSTFSVCVAGPQAQPLSGCDCHDMNADGFVDLADWAEFQVAWTGPVATIPGCTP